MTVAARLVEFVLKTTLADCPEPVLIQVRRAALDTIGCMLAGATEPVAAIVREIARAEGGTPLCTVMGTALRTSPTWAALANGAAGHAHDFDDTSFALLGHPSVPLLAAALAAGEAEMADGATVALAYIIGFEVDAALGLALNPAHYERGWHATTSIGTLGCAAAAARILGLDAGQTRHALGIAASLASGLKENFGSRTKPYHAGHAARNGVLAARLAREGMTASESALDGRQGYAAAFSGVALPAAVFDRLGQRWEIVTSGIAVKPYPSCALTHSAIGTLAALRAEHRLTPQQVARVEVRVNRVVPDVLRHDRPTSALERKFSMPYCAAVALARGGVELGHFGDGPLDDDVRGLMERVTMLVDPTMPEGLEQHAWSRVTVTLTDGRVLAPPLSGAPGHPDHPLDAEALREKFVACAAPVLARDDAAAVADQIDHLEDIPDIRVLTSRLVGEKE
jgi:2-methylcitrate dehydratase PrpD